MKNVIITVLFFATPLLCVAQTSEEIRSDRPGQSMSPFTVGKGFFQLQAGVVNELTSIKNDDDYLIRFTSMNSQWRYGFTENFEVNFGVSYTDFFFRTVVTDFEAQGWRNLSLNLRSNVSEGDGWKPAFGYEVGLNFPIESEEFRTNNIAPKLTLMTVQNPTEKLTITTNTGIAWDGEYTTPYGFYTFSLGYALFDRLSVFGEQYAFYNRTNSERWIHKFDFGLAYLIGNRLQLDVFGGSTLNDGQNRLEWFAEAGISWRVGGNNSNNEE